MRNFYTAVIERAQPVRGQHVTEPYETGWADEALVFVKVRSGLAEHSSLSAQVQVSPDGIDWVDLPGQAASIRDASLAAIQLHNFGGWLRVTLAADQDEPVLASVYLALKG